MPPGIWGGDGPPGRPVWLSQGERLYGGPSGPALVARNYDLNERVRSGEPKGPREWMPEAGRPSRLRRSQERSIPPLSVKLAGSQIPCGHGP